jgi:signal-transduction protein with cAMP-binding, CBS, and nucleotidyltransferase domain
VGSLLVQKDKEYIGILTETDIVQKAVAMNLPAAATRVEEVMTFSLLTVDAGWSILKAADVMMEECVRHLAVAEKKKIIGIISIRDILQTEELPWISIRKVMSSAVFMVATASNVTEAAKLMRYNKIRSLLVTGRKQRPVTEPFLTGNGKEIIGILTETDIIRKVVAEELNPLMTPVEKVMTRQVTAINAWKRTANACDLMAKNKIRHLPVMEGEEIIGIVSMRDLINPLYYNPFCHSRSVQSEEMKQQ